LGELDQAIREVGKLTSEVTNKLSKRKDLLWNIVTRIQEVVAPAFKALPCWASLELVEHGQPNLILGGDGWHVFKRGQMKELPRWVNLKVLQEQVPPQLKTLKEKLKEEDSRLASEISGLDQVLRCLGSGEKKARVKGNRQPG